jgi:hypothetical protein
VTVWDGDFTLGVMMSTLLVAVIAVPVLGVAVVVLILWAAIPALKALRDQGD